MGNAALHPIDTLSTMYNTLSDSFINDVINGDAESRAKWGSYALTQVGLGLIGDKGLSKASKLGQAGKVTKLAKIRFRKLFHILQVIYKWEIALLLLVEIVCDLDLIRLILKS